MGCWGITAFESDAGLDAVGFIRNHLPEDRKLELGKIIEALRKDGWNAPPDTFEADSHTSPMALAEIMVKFLDRDVEAIDHRAASEAKDKHFSSITSFAASREDIRWLRDYLCDTLKYAMKNAEEGQNWGGWFQEKDWLGWQNHMGTLIGRLDGVLFADGNKLVLFSAAAQEAAIGEEPAQASSGMTMK